MLGNIFMTAVNAVFPIVLIILVGYCLKQTGFLSKEFIKTGSKLVFKLLLPAMLFTNVYEINGMEDVSWDILLFCIAMIFIIFLVGLGVTVLTTKDPGRRGALWQGSFRSNFAIIGLPLASALGGDVATAVAAVVVTVAIPMFNILSVVALSVFVPQSGANKLTFKGVIRDIVHNPMTMAVFAGLFCLLVRWLQNLWFGHVVFALNGQTEFLYKVVKYLATVCSPFALLVLGAQCEFSAVKGMFKEITAGVLVRLVIAPVLCIGGAILLDSLGVISCGPNEFPALVAVFGSPTAVSGAIMAAEMKNDEQLATQLVMWTSIVSVVTIFSIVSILMGMGLLNV